MLAEAWACHETELRCDLMRVYGLDFDRFLDGSVSVAQVSALVAGLPLGSSTLASIDKRLGWTRSELLLLTLVNSLRKEPLDPFSEPNCLAMEQDQMAEYLARPRKEVLGVY